MSFQFVFRDAYLFQATALGVKLPILFHPGFRLAINAKLLTGLGDNTRSLGSIYQLLFIDGLGDVKGDSFPLAPSFQLINPTTEFNFRLVYQPVSRPFSVEISIWIDEMPINNPSVPSYQTSTTAASTTVASSVASVAILVANTARKGATVWNASTATLYLDLDATATAADYAARLDPGGYYEVPYGFTGALSGIWSAANGSALVRSSPNAVG